MTVYDRIGLRSVIYRAVSIGVAPERKQVVIEHEVCNQYCLGELGDEVTSYSVEVDPAVSVCGPACAVERMVDQQLSESVVDCELYKQRTKGFFR